MPSLVQRTRAALRAFASGGTSYSRRTIRTFQGALGGRAMGDWNPFVQSPKQEIAWVLTTLRARARQLVRDNAHAAGFLTELANNVVGPEGIMLQAKVTTSRRGDLHTSTNDAIEAAWLEWGMPENASADGYESWTDEQKMFIRTIAQDGEIFIQKVKYFDNPFGFTLRVIDADLVDETYNRAPSSGENEIRLGIEINAWGRPVAYHIWSSYPGEGRERKRERIPADQIIHRFIRYRANQVRGVTWFAPVLANLHMIDAYEFAELVASRVSSAKMAFIVNKSDTAVAAFNWEEKFAPTAPGAEPIERRQMDVEPGLIDELLPGQELQELSPNHPNTAFKEFEKAVLRGVARGLGMAYTTLTGDLEAVNYSSIRAGLLSERDHYRALQSWMAIHICRPIYREWVGMALLTGGLRVDSRIASNYYDVKWQGRGWKWVDPSNDLDAAAKAIQLGLTSRQRLCAEQGVDFEATLDEQKHELEYAKEIGIPLGVNPSIQESKVTVSDPNAPGQGGDTSTPPDTSKGPEDTSAPPGKSAALVRVV